MHANLINIKYISACSRNTEYDGMLAVSVHVALKSLRGILAVKDYLVLWNYTYFVAFSALRKETISLQVVCKRLIQGDISESA